MHTPKRAFWGPFWGWLLDPNGSGQRTFAKFFALPNRTTDILSDPTPACDGLLLMYGQNEFNNGLDGLAAAAAGQDDAQAEEAEAQAAHAPRAQDNGQDAVPPTAAELQRRRAARANVRAIMPGCQPPILRPLCVLTAHVAWPAALTGRWCFLGAEVARRRRTGGAGGVTAWSCRRPSCLCVASVRGA